MININSLCKSFGNNIVLNSLDLNVKKGETKVIIGRSGAGKSVLLKCICGIIKPESGSISIDGVEATGLKEKEYDKLRMKIGMVFQGGALFDSMNVADNVAFVMNEFQKADPVFVRKRVKECLAMVGLNNIEDMMPAQLSGGMRKRVSLARVLCMEPEIILYDEPTTGVDPITADAIDKLIVKMRDDLKITSIVVTHDMNSAYKVANSMAMFYHGRIVAEGTPDEIKTTSHPIVRQFINGLAHGPITDGEELVFGHAK